MRNLITIIILFFTLQQAAAQSYTELCEAGKNHLERKEYRAAAEAFSKANDIAKDNSQRLHTLTNLGQAQSLMNKHEEAA